MFTYYALVDPRNNQIRYIGKTTRRSTQRVADHVYEAKQGRDDAKCRWLRELLQLRLRPIMVVMLVTDKDVEKELIEQYRDVGCDLTNERAGGGGRKGPQVVLNVAGPRILRHNK